jgi:hypothetical protein
VSVTRFFHSLCRLCKHQRRCDDRWEEPDVDDSGRRQLPRGSQRGPLQRHFRWLPRKSGEGGKGSIDRRLKCTLGCSASRFCLSKGLTSLVYSLAWWLFDCTLPSPFGCRVCFAVAKSRWTAVRTTLSKDVYKVGLRYVPLISRGTE